MPSGGHHIQNTQKFQVKTVTKSKRWYMARAKKNSRKDPGAVYRDYYRDVSYDVLWWHDYGNKPPQRGWKFEIKHYGYRDGRPYRDRDQAMIAARNTIDDGKKSIQGLQEYLHDRIRRNLGDHISPL